MASISGMGLAYTAGGTILFFAGYTGQPVKTVLTDFLHGQMPTSVGEPPPTVGIGDTSSGSSSSAGSGGYPAAGSSNATGQAALKQAAARYGWSTGAEWQALSNVEMAEAGFNPDAKNPSSGALGLAQALGHGNSATAGSLGNEYGGYGLTDAQAKEANSGNAYYQAVWMTNYIKSVYGDPEAAWAHEQAYHWY